MNLPRSSLPRDPFVALFDLVLQCVSHQRGFVAGKFDLHDPTCCRVACNECTIYGSPIGRTGLWMNNPGARTAGKNES